MEMDVITLMAEDIITESITETGVPYDGDNWGTGDSWMNSSNN